KLTTARAGAPLKLRLLFNSFFFDLNLIFILLASFLARQTDLSFLAVYLKDLDVNGISHLDDRLWTINLAIGKLRHVQEPFQARLQFDKNAEVCDLGRLALHNLLGLVTLRNVRLPRIAGELLHSQGDALAFLVNVKHDALDLLALLQHFVGM